MLKKGLIAGLAVLVVGFGLNWLLGIIFPALSAQYQNPALFRPWTDPLMMAYFAYPFIFGVVAAYLWNLLKDNLTGNPMDKTFKFARVYFIVATIPGMFITYTSFQISLLMVLSWALVGFAEAFVAGWVFTKIK